MYADDSTFFKSDICIKNLENSVNNELLKVTNWFHANKLSVNVKKSNYMIFSPSLNNSPRLNLYISLNGTNTIIDQIPRLSESQNSFKLLGVFIDEKLTLKEHISHVCKNISKSLFFLSRVKKILPLYCRKQLYFSHIHSYIVYCLPLLSLANKTDISKMERLQRKAIRTAYDVHYRQDTTHLYHDLETISVSDLIERDILMLMHNIYSYKKPKNLANFWKDKTTKHNYLLRSPIQFDEPLVKNIRLSKTPKFHFANIFNNFPGDFQCIAERVEFITLLNKYYHAKYKSSNCNKKYCKFCNYVKWKNHHLQYAITHVPKPRSYIKYL